MAKYPTIKTLKKAIPTIRISDNVVKSWDIEVLYSHTTSNNVTWTRTYSHREDNLEFLNKTAVQFTKSELISFMNSNMDVIFDAHYEAHNLPAIEERVSEFNLNTLS